MAQYHEFVNKSVITRKQHNCEWCPEIILSGTEAQYREYIFEDRHIRGYMHAECYEAMKAQSWLDDSFQMGAQKRGQ